MEATIYADRELTMTVEDFVNVGACYSRELIKKLFAGRKALSAIDVLELDIPDTHKFWAVLREELIPARILHLLAVEFARDALMREREAGREPDERCWRALDVKLAWLDGRASNEELEAAKAAADAAADDAAMAAAKAAGATAGAAYWASDPAFWAAKAAAKAADATVWAAINTALYAARAATLAASSAAANAATRDAAWDAATDATQAEQVAIVKRMLGLVL